MIQGQRAPIQVLYWPDSLRGSFLQKNSNLINMDKKKVATLNLKNDSNTIQNYEYKFPKRT